MKKRTKEESKHNVRWRVGRFRTGVGFDDLVNLASDAAEELDELGVVSGLRRITISLVVCRILTIGRSKCVLSKNLLM